eukprot:TRINITY_DN27044_c0_g1_i1.p1 TRINITY_DN27044_c0_g1~~TRINITY_DN27044_c0_g1_i1.p1  ORF type:complete len:100 (+),score=7.64 TRINITY_DN27044_c0_g1_i1:65-364(+)
MCIRDSSSIKCFATPTSTAMHNLKNPFTQKSRESQVNSPVITKEFKSTGRSPLSEEEGFSKIFDSDVGDCLESPMYLSLIHICRCRRYAVCRTRWSPNH